MNAETGELYDQRCSLGVGLRRVTEAGAPKTETCPPAFRIPQH